VANNETSIIISAVDKTQGALNSVNSNLSSLEGQFSKLTGVVSGFAALAGVTAFAGIVKGAVDSAAGLHDMAQQTGASVESLSAMRAAAKLAGVDMEQVAGGLGKLSKNMLAAAQGSGDAANVFKALGVSVTDSSGKMKSSDAVFMEFSKGLQTVGSTAERAAAAQLVLGKSGATLLPMMNDLAVSGELQAKITAKQAAAADDLQDNMTRLATVGQAWKTTVAMEMVPAANAFVEALLEVSTTTDMSKKAAKDLAADGSIKEWAINSARAVGFVVDAFDGAARTVKGIGILIAAAAAQTAMVAKGDFSGAMAVDWRKDLSDLAGQEQFSDVLARKLANIGTEAPKAAEGTRSLAGALNSLAKEGGKASNVLENLHITQMALITKQAVAELDALTKQQDEYVKALQAALNPLETQAQNLEREVANYGLAESAIQGTIIARMEAARAMAAENGAWPEHLNYLNQEIDARKRIATASSQKDFLDTNKKAAEQSAKEWEKFSDDINRALTDALMRGFEDGKSFGQNFVDSLKNSLKTAALKIVVNVATSTGGNFVNGVINSVGGTAGANNGAGVNYLGLANNASSAYNLYGAGSQFLTGASTGSSAAGLMYANGVQAVGGDGIGALYTANGGWAGVGVEGSAGAAAGSGSSTAGMSASTVGWVAAIVMGMYMSSEAWKAGTRWDGYYNATSNPIEAGPSGPHHQRQDQVARTLFGDSFADSEFFAVMSGNALSQQVHNMVWGGAPKATGISSLSGTFSEENMGFGNGRAGMEYRKAGGWFGSAENSTQWQGVNSSFENMLSGMYQSIRDTYLTVGDIFEDDTLQGKLKGFVQDIYHSNTTDMKASLNLMSEILAQGMGSILFPSIEALRQSGEKWSAAFGRIIQESNTVARVLDLMGKSMAGVFGKDNADGILRASDSIVQLFGSIDALNASFSSYYGNFYTTAEQFNQGFDDLSMQFSRIGLSVPKTRAEFRALVDSLDLSYGWGQSTFASLMSLQGAFAALTPTMDAISTDAIKLQITAAQEAAKSATTIADTFAKIVDSLTDYKSGLLLGDLSTLSTTDKYAEARRVYEDTANMARLGDATAAGNLQSVSDTFLQLARENGTAQSYARDFGQVVGTVDSVITVAGRQIPIAESQLKVAQDQLATLNQMLAAISGDVSASWAANISTSVPAFASGGYHAGGLRLVGERGPELEVTGPSKIIDSGNTLAMLNGGADLLMELKSMRAELEMLREEQRIGNSTIAANTAKTSRSLEKFDIDGMPEVRAA
jgi:hypothetical protein